MTREEVIKNITVEYNSRKVVKEEALEELLAAANEEGCEWGEQVPNVVSLYSSLQPDYISESFANALYEEIINLYIHMLENTQIVELPEREETIKRPAKKYREWVY